MFVLEDKPPSPRQRLATGFVDVFLTVADDTVLSIRYYKRALDGVLSWFDYKGQWAINVACRVDEIPTSAVIMRTMNGEDSRCSVSFPQIQFRARREIATNVAVARTRRSLRNSRAHIKKVHGSIVADLGSVYRETGKVNSRFNIFKFWNQNKNGYLN